MEILIHRHKIKVSEAFYYHFTKIFLWVYEDNATLKESLLLTWKSVWGRVALRDMKKKFKFMILILKALVK